MKIIARHVVGYNFSQASHPGQDCFLRQVQRSYYWTTMKKDIFSYCKLCQSCAEQRLAPSTEAQSLPYPIPHTPYVGFCLRRCNEASAY